MLFNSYEYLFFFLPLSLAGYFALSRRPALATLWLVAASLVFYAWWRPADLALIVTSIVGNFLLGRALQRAHPGGGRLLAIAVGANLAALAVFKYTGFVLGSIAAATGAPLPVVDIALPLGISFFTFTQIAFLVDCRRGRVGEASLANYALFVSFFPHLLSGPILHHSEMMPQFASATNKRPHADELAAGLYLLAIGLAKKVLIADQLAPVADGGFARAASLTTADAWLAVVAYTLQLYFDFSGYTDMALGAARLFNIRMPINFDSPYRATDLRDFWSRWHITLSRFLREYLYIPLGGNRRGVRRSAAILLVTFALGGLWHGAAWTFVAWGVLHGAGLVVLRAWQRTGWRLPPLAGWATTLLFVMTGWVFFRAASLADAASILRAMAGRAPTAGHALTQTSATGLAVVAVATLVALWPRNSNAMVAGFTPRPLNALAAAASLVVCVLQLGRVTPFLYFNF